MSRYYVGQSVAVRGPLAELAEGFADLLWEQGYSSRTVDSQMRMLRDLSGWLEDHGIAVAALDDDVVGAYVSQRRLRTQVLRSEKGVAALLGFLRDRGVVPGPSPKAAEGPARILAEFGGYLREARGLSGATVASYCSQVRPLVWSRGAGAWVSLTAEAVRAFIDERAAAQRPW